MWCRHWFYDCLRFSTKIKAFLMFFSRTNSIFSWNLKFFREVQKFAWLNIRDFQLVLQVYFSDTSYATKEKHRCSECCKKFYVQGPKLDRNILTNVSPNPARNPGPTLKARPDMQPWYDIMFGLLFAFKRIAITTIYALQGYNICVVSHLCLVSHSCKFTVYIN